jgi:hypothetical protein
VLIQAAKKVDNKPELNNEYEVLISVEILNLDSTSMKQIREASKGMQLIIDENYMSDFNFFQS